VSFQRSFGAVLIIAACACAASGFEIIAHRGGADEAPENTVVAAKLALENGADAIEGDVHLTKDGKLVVIHDANTQRTTGVSGVVSAMTLAELRTLDAGRFKDQKFAGEKIPTPDDLLAILPEGKRVILEIKQDVEAIAGLKDALARSGKKPAQLQIICARLGILERVRKEMPECPTLWLPAYRDKKTGEVSDLESVLRQAVAPGITGLLLKDWPVDAAFAEKVHAAKLKLYVSTVNDAAIARKLKNSGVDGVTTDRPTFLWQELTP
jgi:glycerophosphoryl diester phosphodiesterase